ncbi:hypothetical protein K466DRAFT_175518 [Polyporus arcularius HHB13444]|uniref:Uncharacterized protein n=1 Tax=Polyporus arcularius HHB13444 TaxID=1314778 RepID=A0A5C3PW04_9APHY|nr:hypothetical protein K466DRAFT_175518 [Polyporus arcularius HHB13444]
MVLSGTVGQWLPADYDDACIVSALVIRGYVHARLVEWARLLVMIGRPGCSAALSCRSRPSYVLSPGEGMCYTGSSQRLRPPLWCAIIARRSALTILRFSFRHRQRRLLLNNSLKLSTPVTFRVFGAAATIPAMCVKYSVNVADPVSCIQFHSAATEMHDTLILNSTEHTLRLLSRSSSGDLGSRARGWVTWLVHLISIDI